MSRNLTVYVCCAYEWAPKVRDFHATLRARGITPVSSWAESARGPERLDELTDAEADAIWAANREAIEACNVAVVFADSPGRDTFGEAEYARALGKRVVWIGRETITARKMRREWTRVSHVGAAIDALCAMAREVAA